MLPVFIKIYGLEHLNLTEAIKNYTTLGNDLFLQSFISTYN